MKYRLTPFNVVSVAITGRIIWYFICSSKDPYYDRHGWMFVMEIMPLIAGVLVLLIIDGLIQYTNRARKYSWILKAEGLVIIALACAWALSKL